MTCLLFLLLGAEIHVLQAISHPPSPFVCVTYEPDRSESGRRGNPSQIIPGGSTSVSFAQKDSKDFCGTPKMF
ncbi:hypothetical protein TNCT_606221 [Trichonephila clavata]|uniref:Secreted protein n=1 Tax=Trichonephila clavata TaxID=2740835 RepID=A0A8X6FHM7_TRICU|nr:hypothetical protein TNCT_606221 [Trichonephila clavata]